MRRARGRVLRVRLVDPLDPAATVPPGTQGQVAVSMASPEAFRGYRRRPDADARAIRDGWYLTGDLAAEDGDGDLWVSGRVDDMINSGGENIYPDEIEDALARCPAVSAVVVAGLPDDRWGQAVTAFVVAVQDLSPERAVVDLAEYVARPVRAGRHQTAQALHRGKAHPHVGGRARSCAASSPKAATSRSPRSGRETSRDRGPGPQSRTPPCSAGRAGSWMTWTRCPARWSPPSRAALTRTPGSPASTPEPALASPGVTAVIGPQDVARGLRPFPLSVRTPMPYYAAATDRVGSRGEPVAVVVAADRYLAEDAAELVEVGYEELPAVTGTRAALADDAPRLHPEAESNVATDRTFSFGPVEQAFAEAGHVVSGDYSFPRYSSMPLECYSVIANWTEDAEGAAVEAWANFHGPFSMIPVLAGALGLPAARLRLHVPADIGGSFGIKAASTPTSR